MFVTDSGAGPPLLILYLIPKSASGPPGLCEAVRMIPPVALYFRMMFEAAGVESRPSLPMISFFTPLAAAIWRMLLIVTSLWNLPSPPITSVEPAAPPGMARRIDWTKFSV